MNSPKRTTPPADWQLVHRVRWYAWIPLSLYGIVVDLFMGMLGLGGALWGLAFLFGLLPKESIPVIKDTPNLQFYGIFLLELAGALLLAWAGLRNTRDELLDIFTSALTFDGLLDQIETQTRQTKNGSYRVFAFSAQGKSWEIAYHDLSDRFEFQRRVKAGRPVRLRYRRGSGLVTEVWAGRTKIR